MASEIRQASTTPARASTRWRPIGVLLHRWLGLFTALFLFISGLTGAFISWDHELDALLNPQLFEARTQGEPQSSLALARQVEAADPRLRVTYLPLAVEPGHALAMSVEARPDSATGKLSDPGFNQVALDPATGDVQGRRMWGDVSLARENLLPFLYKLHYSMHIPNGFGIELGIWFMGIVALVWLVDGAIALWLSFPNLNAWRKSLAFRWRKGGYALNFDLHRSGGVCVWALLLIVAFTSLSMNLQREVVRPLVSVFSTLSTTPFDVRTPRPPDQPIEPRITREEAVALAREEAARRGWTMPPGGVLYASAHGVYGVGFFTPDNDHGDGGLGNPWLYFDGLDGSPAGEVVPGTGSAGDIFMQAQFPLHSGRLLGIPGRILMSVMGLAVAMLSLTGLVIWAKKRKSRAASIAHRDRRHRAAVRPASRRTTPAH